MCLCRELRRDLNLSATLGRDNARMARALAYAQQAAHDPLEIASTLIVCGCAVALIAAGQALPFLSV